MKKKFRNDRANEPESGNFAQAYLLTAIAHQDARAVECGMLGFARLTAGSSLPSRHRNFLPVELLRITPRDGSGAQACTLEAMRPRDFRRI